MRRSDDHRIRRFEQQSRSGPLWNMVGSQFDPRIPTPTQLSALSTYNATSHQNRIAVQWIDSNDPQVEFYDIWVQLPTGSRIHAHSVPKSPSIYDLGTTQAGPAVIFVQPVLRNGLKLDLDLCPTVAVTLTV